MEDSICFPGVGQKNCSLAESLSSDQVLIRSSESDWSTILVSPLIRNCSLEMLKYQQISHAGFDFISSSFLLLESVIILIELDVSVKPRKTTVRLAGSASFEMVAN